MGVWVAWRFTRVVGPESMGGTAPDLPRHRQLSFECRGPYWQPTIRLSLPANVHPRICDRLLCDGELRQERDRQCPQVVDQEFLGRCINGHELEGGAAGS